MTKKYNSLFLFILLSSHVGASEPSAFGAGDLSVPAPYGLTSSESAILETKKNLQKITVKSNNQANEVDGLKERIDGLSTVLDGLNQSTHENRLKLKKIEDDNLVKAKNEPEFNKRISDLIQENSTQIELNKKNIEKLNLSLVQITKLLDSINLSYVKKDEFNALVDSVNNFKDIVAKGIKNADKQKEPLEEKTAKDSQESKAQESKAQDSKKETKESKISNAKLESEARSAYSKRDYKKSIELYEKLVENGHKAPYANYMIGESEYYKKNYAKAIIHYKKSALEDDKSSYIPTLMLHTAISMEESGDKKNAKIFYDAVLSKYPDSKESQIAKKRVKN